MALSRALNVGQGAPALAELIAEFQKNEKTLHLIARQSFSTVRAMRGGAEDFLEKRAKRKAARGRAPRNCA